MSVAGMLIIIWKTNEEVEKRASGLFWRVTASKARLTFHGDFARRAACERYQLACLRRGKGKAQSRLAPLDPESSPIMKLVR